MQKLKVHYRSITVTVIARINIDQLAKEGHFNDPIAEDMRKYY